MIHKAIGTFGDLTYVEESDKHFRVSEPFKTGPEKSPLVVVFGWAGATHKNLSKYSQVYTDRGCTTTQYILPTRFIFRHTEQVHEVMEDLAKFIVHNTQKDSSTPVVVHCLSDTGVISFQGLTIACEALGHNLSPDGIVWDSCPGPRPTVTIPRGLLLCAINWFSRMRDGMSFGRAVSSSYLDFRDLAWRNYIRRLKGLDAKLSLMDNVWAGYWARDLPMSGLELFIYSKTDIYTPYRHLESEVIPKRFSVSKQMKTRFWEKSPHVGHLRAHPLEYCREIDLFLDQIRKQDE